MSEEKGKRRHGLRLLLSGLLLLAVMGLIFYMSAQDAAEKALMDLNNELIERNGYAQAMSLVCLDKEGNYGVSTNVPFTFTYASEKASPALYEAVYTDGKTVITKIKEES